ncbi:MAG: MBG domain-containing protein [Terracidiphilus sp.]
MLSRTGLEPSTPNARIGLRTLRVRTAVCVAAVSAIFSGDCPAQTAHFSGAIQVLGSGFSSPGGVAVDANGNVYVANFAGPSVQEILAVNGSIPASPTIVTLSTAFQAPTNVAVDAEGDVFVTDGSNGTGPAGAVYEIVAVNGSIPASPTIRTLGSGFNAPEGVAVDGSGNVFVADTYNNAVKEMLAVNGSVPTTPTINTLGSGFSQPAGVAVDGSGDVFVADSNNNAVKEMLAVSGSIPSTPTINTLGSGFNIPSDVAVDANGDVFVIDYGDNTLKEMLAVSGSIPASDPTIVTLGGGFNQPPAIGLDGSGDVFVADFGNNLVKEVTPPGGSFGEVNVGSASAAAVNLEFIFDTAGTLGSTSVVMQGKTGMDFSDAGGDTCLANTAYTAGESCQINVSFKPAAPGARHGAAELLDGSGNVLATGLVKGVGEGPEAGFRYVYGNASPPVAATTADITSGTYFTVDDPGNILIANNQHSNPPPVNGSVLVIPASGGGYGTPIVLGSSLPWPQGVAEDGAGNIYALIDADANYDPGTGYVIEYPKIAGGYGAGVTVASNLVYPNGLAMDGFGNLFYASYSDALITNPPNTGAVMELPWNGTSYGSPVTLAGGLNFPAFLRMDWQGDLFVTVPEDTNADANSGYVLELKKSGAGYASPSTVVGGLNYVSGVAVDAGGSLLLMTFSAQNSGDSNLWDLLEIPITSGGAGTPVALATLPNVQDVAVDSAGDIFLLIYQTQVLEIPRSRAPALTFASTPFGQTSSDSPQTVTLESIGNEELLFPAPTSGSTPSIAPGFQLGSEETECPMQTPGNATGHVDPGSYCTLEVSFKPTMAGANSGTLVVTDNSLNATAPNYAKQTIALSGTATQDAQTISFTAPPSTLTYGAAPVALSATASSGLAVSFGVTGPATLSGTTLRITGAGNIVITASQAGNADYQAAAPVQRTITVLPGLLTVMVKNATREYGKSNSVFTDSITGFVNGDTAAKAFTGAAKLTTSATMKTGAGDYPIVAAMGTLSSANYHFRLVNGTLTITKAPLTIAANNAKALYGQTLPKFGYTATGFVNGDTKSVLSGAPLETTKAVRGSLPGTYAIAIAAGKLKAANYSFNFKDGVLTIVPAGATATPKFKPGTGTYTSPQKVTISDVTPGAVVYYALGGATPTTKSKQYKGAITVSANVTIKAIGVAKGYTQSAVGTATYTFE